MQEEDFLECRDGSKIYFMPKNFKLFLRKLTLIFGGSGSGKSILLDEIMNLLHNHIPTVFVIARTNTANAAYDGKVAPICIQDGRNAKKTVKWLEDFLIRQKNAANAYTKAHDLKILKPLFDKVANQKCVMLENKIIERTRANLIYVAADPSLNPAARRTQKKKIEKKRGETLMILYRSVLRCRKDDLEKNKAGLTEDQAVALAFLDFNPHAMLILDDCASQFKLWAKMSTAIKELFYEGRHYFITTAIISQDDKEIDSELRKGSMVSLFATDQIAISNFTRVSNSYPKHIAQKAKLCIEAVFKQEKGEPEHFQKLAYIRGVADPFRYTVADLYDDFRMGSPAMWEFSKRIEESSNKRRTSNPLVEKYT